MSVDRRRKCKLRGLVVYLMGIFLILSSNIFTFLGEAFNIHFLAFIIVGFILAIPVRYLLERKCRGGAVEESDERPPLEIEDTEQENVVIY